MDKIYTREDLAVKLKEYKKVLVLFYATWCPFCVGFVPTFDKTVATMGFEKVIHVLLDDYDNELWDDYDVPAVPTIIYFEDGKVCKRIDAQLGRGLNEQSFKKWIEEFKLQNVV
jgi:thiol-disulfide isomerase/thioredoxin